jgi:hypothetical protein
LALAESKPKKVVKTMTILEMFEKISLKTPIEQRKFFNYYDDSVNELLATYDIVIEDGKTYAPITDLYEDNVVLPLYHNAIVDNILFMISNEAEYKSEFIRKSKDAYLKYWKDKAKGTRQRRMRW